MNQSILSSAKQQQVSALLKMMGNTHFGYAQLNEPISFAFYESWLNEGHHGEMAYLLEHAPTKKKPQQLLKTAKSAIVIGFNYIPHPEPVTESTALRIAFYARGKDYHFWIKGQLINIVNNLLKLFPEDDFLAITDSSPILERDFAYQAGLGWFGKNTCLIHERKGSLFLIGEILTSIDLFSDIPSNKSNIHPERCGTCTRCIEACPTSAIIEPKKIDARKCISYLTIEAKTIPPKELRNKMGDNFFGCDICQNVCPWNEKFYGSTVKNEASTKLKPTLELENELRFILKSSNKNLEKKYKNSPLSRARGFGLKRNAIIVVANQNLTSLREEVAAYKADPRLAELSSWALEQLE